MTALNALGSGDCRREQSDCAGELGVAMKSKIRWPAMSRTLGEPSVSCTTGGMIKRISGRLPN
jgi:hypothetical protein